MVRFGNPGQDLARRTPFTLFALTEHPIEPHEEQWFARCRTDYLRSFPLLLLEAVRLLVLVSLVGPLNNLYFSMIAVFGWVLIVSAQSSVRRLEKRPGFDQKKALGYRAGTIRIRTFWWCSLLCWGIVIAPETNMTALIALGLATMVIDGISTLTLPHQAMIVSTLDSVAIVSGCFMRDGPVASLTIAVITTVMWSFLHWSIYNLYYMFATRRIRTRRLAESHGTVQLLLNQYDDEGSDWLYQIDEHGLIHDASSRFAQACGKTCEQLEGTSFVDLFEACSGREHLVTQFRSGGAIRNVNVRLKAGDEQRWWSVSGRRMDENTDNPSGWRGFIADISKTKQAEAEVSKLAHFDMLTQLPNRNQFQISLERAIADRETKSTICLLYVDIDHFKSINDGFGHGTGDAVLSITARRLEEAVQGRGLVARLGGDEFVVLLPNLNSVDGGLFIADRVQKACNAPAEVNGQMLHIGTSTGVAFAPNDAKSADRLLRAADLALYDAKERGRGCISVFGKQMQRDMERKRDLELGLRGALAAQELELHYQPQHDVRTGQVAGYEALLRWNSKEHGPVSPLEFIPIAESSGLIIEIGNWILRTAMAEAARWPDHLSVAINISAVQLREQSFQSTVLNALAQSGVAPHRIELEITESVLMQDSERVRRVINKLREQGVQIALDDFGTGYSSLNYVRSFPFDCIKIDRSFVSELTDREDCQAIVKSVIALARDLNIKTVAEGVEVAEQLEMLRAGGCDQVQGWLFSKALHPSMLPDYGYGPVSESATEVTVLEQPVRAETAQRKSRKAA